MDHYRIKPDTLVNLRGHDAQDTGDYKHKEAKQGISVHILLPDTGPCRLGLLRRTPSGGPLTSWRIFVVEDQQSGRETPGQSATST